MAEKTQEKTLAEYLEGYDQDEVLCYVNYAKELCTNEKTDFWAKKISKSQYAEFFKKVKKEGLILDGKHITIQKSGLTYDYVALKNKMILVYPESIIDTQLVFKGDTFTVLKESGKVLYSHTIADAFNQLDEDVIGGYCVIKNKRGEFFTPLSMAEIEKRRKVAKGDFIWKLWFKEMALKTIIKKACSQHFSDIYENILSQDNETSNDLNSALDIDLVWKQEVEALETLETLAEYYKQNAGRGKDFARLITKRKKELSTTN